MVRETVGRETEKSSAKSLIEYSPVSCIRHSSLCCLAESLGRLPLSFPLARAMAMPSRVRRRIKSASNSAKVAKMLKRHLENILTYLQHPITNAVTEGLNSKIQMIKSNARGFRSFENYRTRILFFCGKLDLYPL